VFSPKREMDWVVGGTRELSPLARIMNLTAVNTYCSASGSDSISDTILYLVSGHRYSYEKYRVPTFYYDIILFRVFHKIFSSKDTNPYLQFILTTYP